MADITIPSPISRAHDLAIAFIEKSNHNKNKQEFFEAYEEAYDFFFKSLIETAKDNH